VLPPELPWLAEVLLLSRGFRSAHKLGRSLARLWTQLAHQVAHKHYSLLSLSIVQQMPSSLGINIRSLKLVVQGATGLPEAQAICSSIRDLLYPRISHPSELDQREEAGEIVCSSQDLAAWNKLNQLLSLHFPEAASHEKDGLGELGKAIEAQLREQHLQTLPPLVNKVSHHACTDVCMF